MSSTLIDTDIIIVDIDSLMHKEKKGIGGGGLGPGLENCDDSEADESENYFLIDEPVSDPSLDSQIVKNLNQLELLIQLIRKRIVDKSQYSFELNRLDYLMARLNNMFELFEFYKAKRDQTSFNVDQNELKFLQFLLVTRLNKLNGLFNLNQAAGSFLFKQRESESDSILNETHPDIKVLDLNKRKLRINSIQLDDQEFDVDSNAGEQQKATKSVDFMCAVYQFDNSSELFLLKQSLLNATAAAATPQVSTKLKQTKRSLSADNYNSTLKRKLRQSRLHNSKSKCDQLEQQQQTQNQLNTDNQTAMDRLDDSFKLNEKCIAINSFKFKLTKSASLNECIKLEPNCTHVKIIVYKLVKLRNTGANKTASSNNQYKNPIKYVSINVTSRISSSASANPTGLLDKLKLDLKPFLNTLNTRRIVNSSRRSAAKKETASSMLKRMFTKAKPSQLNENNQL